MRTADIRNNRRLGKAREDEATDLVQRLGPVPLAERIVEEAGQYMALLDRAAEIFEEAVLRGMAHDEIAAGNQKLRRHRDGAGIRHHAIGRLVELQQDVGCDGPGDQRIGLE